MTIVGFSDSHNSAAALLDNGSVAAAVAEERITRVKNWLGFPVKSLEACLDIAGREMGDVDTFALTGLAAPFAFTDRAKIIAAFRDNPSAPRRLVAASKSALVNGMYRGPLKKLYRRTALWRARDRARWQSRFAELLRLGVDLSQIRVVEHHQAHAAAAYYGWGRYDDEVLVITNDGGGDSLCATVNIGRQGRLERIAQVHWHESIAYLYGVTTAILGMVPLEHEYKLMGLAPYADQKKGAELARKLRSAYEFDARGGLSWHRRRGMPPAPASYNHLRDLFEPYRFDTIAAGVQRFLEDFCCEWVRNCIRTTGIRRVALAGGMFMNVKLNKLLMELPEVAELFVFPSCADETNAIGAAYDAHAAAHGVADLQPFGNMCIGRSFSDLEIADALQQYPFRHPVAVTRVSNVAAAVADLLARGEIVARFDGREEFGARALGNRSILADPARVSAVKTINDAIKARDFWMPFAPAILDRRVDDYFHNPKRVPAPHMILSFDSTDRIVEIAAAAHPYDGTIRPQVVSRDGNPRFFDLLEQFELRTGRGALLNTSFNLHGLPIVGTPADALHVLDVSGLNWLAIGDYLVGKRDSTAEPVGDLQSSAVAIPSIA